MKKFFKFGCLSVIGLIVVVVIISAVASHGSNSSSTSAPANSGTKTSSSQTSAAPKQDSTKTFKIGDTVQVGKMTYIISKKTVADQVGPSALPTKANGKYVVVEVSLTNGDNKAITVDSSFFKLKRGDKTFEADSTASMSANQGEDGSIKNSFFLQQVNPDSQVKGLVVFDVAPDVANATDLQLQVQTGAFGTQTQVINLQ